MMRQTIFRAGIASEDVQDVAMDILALFIEKDGINYYDAERLHDVGESPDLPGDRYRKAKFKGMLRGFTATYVMQYRDKQMTRHRREPWRLQATWAAPHARIDNMPTTWEEHEDYAVDPLADVEDAVVLVSAIRRTREILVERSTKKRDYARFIDLLVEHGCLDGRLDRRALQDALGISPSTLTQMINEMRGILRPMLSEAGMLPECAPVRAVREAEVTVAVAS